MVLCRYFLEGRCRFGQDCRYEHGTPNRPNQHHHQPQQQQGYHSNQQYFPQKQQSSYSAPPTQDQVYNIEELMKVVEADSLSWEMGGQWLFSVYAPLIRHYLKTKNNPNEENLPGLVDFSPEELRWEAIQANAVGQFQEYLMKLQPLSSSQQNIRRALQKLDQNTRRFIAGFERGERVSPVGTALDTALNSSMIISSPQHQPINLQSPPASKFSFTLPATPAPAPAPVLSSPPASSPFRFQLNVNTPVIQQPTVLYQSPLTTAPVVVPTVFNAHSTENTSNVKNNDTFSSLSDSDMEQYRANHFTFGKIPRVPPPKEMR